MQKCYITHEKISISCDLQNRKFDIRTQHYHDIAEKLLVWQLNNNHSLTHSEPNQHPDFNGVYALLYTVVPYIYVERTLVNCYNLCPIQLL
jgi:hypothetical protein